MCVHMYLCAFENNVLITGKNSFDAHFGQFLKYNFLERFKSSIYKRSGSFYKEELILLLFAYEAYNLI